MSAAWFTMAAALGISLCAVSARAQTPPPADPAGGAAENDPTRPVLLSLRPEYYNGAGELAQSKLILRYDQANFRQRRWLPGRRGAIFRFEVPFARTDLGGGGDTGIGDAYAQLLLIPYFTRRFAVVAGTGALMPTATSELLGTGKLVMAPVAGPLWFMQGRRGLVFVKFQNFVSVAGDDSRADLNFFLVTPMVLRTFQERWWVLADTETKTDWRRDGRTGVKSGLQIGHAIAEGVGVWAKPEVWWGANRDGRWNLKIGIVWHR